MSLRCRGRCQGPGPGPGTSWCALLPPSTLGTETDREREGERTGDDPANQRPIQVANSAGTSPPPQGGQGDPLGPAPTGTSTASTSTASTSTVPVDPDFHSQGGGEDAGLVLERMGVLPVSPTTVTRVRFPGCGRPMLHAHPPATRDPPHAHPLLPSCLRGNPSGSPFIPSSTSAPAPSGSTTTTITTTSDNVDGDNNRSCSTNPFVDFLHRLASLGVFYFLGSFLLFVLGSVLARRAAYRPPRDSPPSNRVPVSGLAETRNHEPRTRASQPTLFCPPRHTNLPPNSSFHLPAPLSPISSPVGPCHRRVKKPEKRHSFTGAQLPAITCPGHPREAASASMASTAPPRHVRQKPMNQNRPPQILERHTKGGRRLRYELRVIQQPERARACGSGAKSSADRRPVDPPPVVELKIFEVVGLDPREDPDITFAYNANFFLFATLEMARPIAHGRVAPPAPAQVPVLTGMPVSGMAYLDRPSEAGYFIFPDLSVRHEGKYRLSFNLYEETKKPEEDADQEPPVEGKLPAGQEPEACFDWRMEIKSDAFDVFSAKKFPGLAESTSLSRLVAEQGCRVRIRRDVRMRRRGEKGSEDFEEEVYERQARAPVSDELHRERSRSLSTGSDGERRQPYEQPPSHLGFMGGRQYPQPQFAAPPPAVPAARFPASGYGPQPNYGQAAPPPPQAPHLGYERQFPPSAYPSNPPRELLHEDDSWRRASAAGHPHEQHPHRQYAIEHSFNHHPHPFPYASRSPAPGDLPPLQLHHLSGKPDGSSAAPLPSVRSFAPVLHSPTYERREERSDLYAPAPKGASLAAAPPAPEAPAPRNGKRSFDTTFSASAEPLYNGMRPSTPHDQDAVEDDDDRLPTVAEMHYKRADGTHQIRPPVAVV